MSGPLFLWKKKTKLNKAVNALNWFYFQIWKGHSFMMMVAYHVCSWLTCNRWFHWESQIMAIWKNPMILLYDNCVPTSPNSNAKETTKQHARHHRLVLPIRGHHFPASHRSNMIVSIIWKRALRVAVPNRLILHTWMRQDRSCTYILLHTNA